MFAVTITVVAEGLIYIVSFSLLLVTVWLVIVHVSAYEPKPVECEFCGNVTWCENVVLVCKPCKKVYYP